MFNFLSQPVENWNFSNWFILVLTTIILLTIITGSYFSVSVGEVGVLFNKITATKSSFQQGFHFKIPLIQAITHFDVKTQKVDVNSTGASKNLQEIRYETVINYHLEYDKVNNLYTKVGKDYIDKVIVPCVNESLKAATALFPVEEIIQKRYELKQIAEQHIRDRLTNYNIILEAMNIVDIDFTDEFNKVVEEKQMEEQKIKTAEYQRRQAEEYKKKTILEAEAEAQKQNLLRQTTSKEVISLKWIEKWNGQLPQYLMGKDADILVTPGK